MCSKKLNPIINILKEKLESHISKNYKSVWEFERANNLKRYSVYDIIRDRSTNPTFSLLIGIADALDCSIDELAERQNFYTPKESEDNTISVVSTLLKEVSVFTAKFLDYHNITDSKLVNIFQYIKEIYNHSSANSNGKFDEEFAESFLKKVFNKTSDKSNSDL